MDDNGYNEGSDQGQQGGVSDSGSPTGGNTQDFGNTGNAGSQNGQQTDARDAELTKMREQNRALNRALVESRRTSNQNRNNQNAQGQDGNANTFDTPEGQYAASLQIATGTLIQKMESIYDLYPEVPASEISRIRKNPWAFASHDSYITGNVDDAALQIEQALADRAAEIEREQGGQAGSQQAQRQTPAQVNSNPAQEVMDDAEPGSAEDNDPWTMPMDKLAKLKNKELAKVKSSK